MFFQIIYHGAMLRSSLKLVPAEVGALLIPFAPLLVAPGRGGCFNHVTFAKLGFDILGHALFRSIHLIRRSILLSVWVPIF